MNSTIYIFGDLGNGYAQYPNDYTTEIFLQFQKHTQATTQLTIHRDENLMYYGYVRRLHQKGQYIGICIVLNGIMFRGIKTLFNRFENYITDMVVRGQIIEFSDSGDLISTVTNLYERQQEIERITTFIQNDIETLTTQKLPPLNFSIGKNESKSFLIDDKAESILEATYKYGYTYVYKDAEYNTSTLTSYSGKLQTLNKEYTAALQTIDKQKQEISDLKKKQKNYKLVIWLIVFICIGGIIFISTINSRNTQIQNLKDDIQEQQQQIETQTQTIEEINSDLSNAKTQIISLNQTIQEQTDNIQSLQIDIENKNQTISALNTTIKEQDISITKLREDNSDLSKIKKELSDLKNYIKNELPLIITDIEIANGDYDGNVETDYGKKIYASSTMFLKPRIKYIGFISDYKTLKVKWYNPDGSLRTGKSSPEGFTLSETYYIRTESNTLTLPGWGNKNKGHWKKGTYRIEIWYEDICLKVKTFTVY